MNRAKLIPLRDFFRNPERSRFQVSPDGNSIAFTANLAHLLFFATQCIGSDRNCKIASICCRCRGSHPVRAGHDANGAGKLVRAAYRYLRC